MKSSDLARFLRSVPMFAGLGERQLAAFAASAAVRTHKQGEVLFRAGDAADRFLLVVSGCVKVYALSPEGREHVLHVVSPPGLVAESAVFAEATYPAWAQTTERSRIAIFFRERFIETIRSDPEFALQCMAGLARRLREFVAKIEDLSLRDVTARLAGYLLQNAEGRRCALPVRKSVLAAHLGTVAEALSRSLRKLKDAGMIREDGAAIHILAPARLAALHETGGVGDR